MISALFPLLGFIDSLMRKLLPLPLCVVLWGLATGVVVMGLYALASPQERIRKKKEQIRELQKGLRDTGMGFSETMALSKKNLSQSMGLLGLVLGPSLLSALPALLMLAFMFYYYNNAPLLPGEVIVIRTTPAVEGLRAEPRPEGVAASGGATLLSYKPGESVRISVGEPGIGDRVVGDRLLYEGDPFDPPMDRIAKRARWDWLLGNPAGYLEPDAPVDELRFMLRKLRLFSGGPGWAAGWELVYFVSLFASAVFIKIRFKVH